MSLDGALVWLRAGHQQCGLCSLLGGVLVQAKTTIACAGLGPPGSYKMTCSWLPLVLGWEVLERGYAMN